jgi:hypothetical protein
MPLVIRGTENSMQFTRANTTTSLLVAQAAALMVGYVIKAPDLSKSAERSASIRHQQTDAAFDQQEAIARAQRCVVLLTETPITDGTTAYFSSLKNGRLVANKKRPLPDGTNVCDSFGNTGVVTTDTDGNPVIADIRQMPPEDMKDILSKRGVMPRKSTHPVEN